MPKINCHSEHFYLLGKKNFLLVEKAFTRDNNGKILKFLLPSENSLPLLLPCSKLWENADVNNLFQMVSPTWGVWTTSTDRHQNLPPGKMCRKAEGFYLHFTQGDGKSPKLNKEDNFIRCYFWWRVWLEMSLFPSNPTHSHPCDTINPHSWCVKTDSGGQMQSLKWG